MIAQNTRIRAPMKWQTIDRFFGQLHPADAIDEDRFLMRLSG